MNSAKRQHNYVVQFLWREVTLGFDIIGPYFTCPSTVETCFLHSIVTRTILAFTQFGFGVRALLCDGASTNLSLLKLLCGHSNELDNITLWFTSPFDGKVFLIVCPSHQVCILNLLMYTIPVGYCCRFVAHTAQTYTQHMHTHTHTHAHTVPSYSFIQLKNMIAALYSSREKGIKAFRQGDVHFGWDTIVRVYNCDIFWANHDVS